MYNDNNNYNRNRQNNNQNEGNDWLSWVVIAALIFGGGWFIGLPLLFVKLFKSDKPNQQKTAPSLNTERRWEQQQAAQRRAAEEAFAQGQRYERQKAAAEKKQESERSVSSITKTPAASKVGSLAMILCGVFVSIIGFALTGDALSSSFSAGVLFELLWGLGVLAGSGALIGFGVGNLKAEKRLPRYLAIIGKNQAVEIKSLAKKTGVKEKTVRKDLQKMVDRGVFGPGAYINDELGFLFVSSEADAELREARERAEEKTRQARMGLDDEVDAYEKLLRQIRDVNDRIAQPEMTAKIYELEEITRQIFTTVKENPDKRAKIDKFMTYYLPTTLKLLESYARLEKTGVGGDNISQSRETIEAAMDNIVTGFKNQLDELYKTDALDIETDIDVMTKMMSREKPKSDFAVAAGAGTPTAAPAAQPADTRTQFQKDFGLESAMGDPFGTGATGSGTAAAGGSAVEYK